MFEFLRQEGEPVVRLRVTWDTGQIHICVISLFDTTSEVPNAEMLQKIKSSEYTSSLVGTWISFGDGTHEVLIVDTPY